MMLIVLFVAMLVIMFALEDQSQKHRRRREGILRYAQIRLKNMGNFTENG